MPLHRSLRPSLYMRSPSQGTSAICAGNAPFRALALRGSYDAHMDPDPHRPLRDDVRLLGALLGDTLKALEGEPLYAAVEQVRALAKDAQDGGRDAFAALDRALRAVPVERAVPVARAFAHFLALANIAEQHHRIRRRRDYLREPAAAPQRASFADTFGRLQATGIGAE